MRPDGTPARGVSAIQRALPYVMPQRYDAQNWTSDTVNEDTVRAYIRRKRKEGRRVTHMGLLMAAYYKAALEHPEVNRFIMNRRIYQRNHFCFSFVMLKLRADGSPDETSIKVFLDPADTVFSVTEKIRALVERNQAAEHDNGTDRFVNFAFSVPLLPRLIFGLAYHLDLHGLLPRAIIDLSPFHTSVFVTNLASINTQYIYHHCYQFGTTSLFVCMGRPERGPDGGRVMPLGIVMDERIATGAEYARFLTAFQRYMRQPELLETRLDGAEECSNGRPQGPV